MRYFLQLSYNGLAYHGWQIQPNGTTVQEVLNDRLSRLLRKEIMVTGCGRTDAGVHARDFYAHFDFPEEWDTAQCHQIAHRLNRFLPRDIAIHKVIPVIHDAHARFSAISRRYHYILSLHKDPFLDQFAWLFPVKLDLEAMQSAARVLLEYKDFGCFSKVDTDAHGSICNLMEISWIQQYNLLIFDIKANRFLRNMVRAIVGTLLDIGRNRYDEEKLREILASGSRSEAGESVPAHGLYLVEVCYPEDIFMV